MPAKNIPAKSRKRESPAGRPAKTPEPACVLIAGEGSCPAWEELLPQFPMIDSVQREDFPDHGASFAYLAHFYRPGETPGTCARALREFRKFFRTIGYTYTSSGDYDGRWFEGVGLRMDEQGREEPG